MARSNGRAAVVLALYAGLFFANQSVNFVTPSRPSLASKSHLRSHVSLAASKEEIAAAQKKVQLLTWAADKLTADSSPDAIAMRAKADAAVAELEALKNGEVAAPVAVAPVVAAPAPVAAAPAPVAAAPVSIPSTVSKADLAAAKKKVDLLTWSANKLMSEGSPSAPAMQAKAAAAVAEFEALKKGEAAPAAVAAAPVAAAPVAAAPVATPSTVSKAELAAAKKKADLLTWSAEKLMSEGSPLAPAMQAKAASAEAEFEALKKGMAAPAAPTVPVPAPVAAAPVASPSAFSTADLAAAKQQVTKADLAAAKKKAELLTWAAAKVAGTPAGPGMQAKADAAVAELAAMQRSM